MSASSTMGRSSQGFLPPVLQQLLKLIGLAFLDAFGMLIFYTLWGAEQQGLALTFLVATVLVNVIVFVPRLYPLRWMSPGMVMMILMVIYPIIFTFLTAFTNYSDGHLFSKEQSIALHERATYIPEDAPVYSFTPFISQTDESELALWLTRDNDDGSTEVIWATVGTVDEVQGNDPAAPDEYEGYRQLSRAEMLQNITTLQNSMFGAEPDTISVTSPTAAARAVQRYTYDAEEDAIYDNRDDVLYVADPESGSWLASKGQADETILNPGFRVWVGFENFVRFLSDETIRGPLSIVFIWTVSFAFLSVLTTFVLGLFMALILNEKSIPYRKLLRSLLIVPYAIPGVISILAWKGMMNPNLGVMAGTFGIHAPWFSSALWSKIGILLINLWLGYPYMMLITSGALQSIPSDIYEAAEVDGANSNQRFWNITLPLLLVAVGPLLIASFTFNFNNFVVIEAFNEGGPPIPGTLTPAGYTDILISYTYRLAFGSGRGADYGLASAITIVIFLIVAGITLINFRFTGQWEEVSENV